MFATKATDLDALKGKYNDTNKRYCDAVSAHRAVTESGEDPDNFMKETGEVLSETKTELEGFNKQLDVYKTRLTKVNDFY